MGETLDAAAIADHELYMSWIRAGFNSDQAMQLLLQTRLFRQQADVSAEYHDAHCEYCKEFRAQG